MLSDLNKKEHRTFNERKKPMVGYRTYECSGTGSIGSVNLWASRIQIRTGNYLYGVIPSSPSKEKFDVFDFFLTDINVPTISNKQKKPDFFVGILTLSEEKSRIRIHSVPVVRVLGSGSVSNGL
jgi:hypothetical protein